MFKHAGLAIIELIILFLALQVSLKTSYRVDERCTGRVRVCVSVTGVVMLAKGSLEEWVRRTMGEHPEPEERSRN